MTNKYETYGITYDIPPVLLPQGRAVMVFEVARPTPETTPAQLAKMAKDYVAAGAGALAVCIDSGETPEGVKDLFAVTQAVRVPVLAKDWYIHPLQVGAWLAGARLGARQAGAWLAGG